MASVANQRFDTAQSVHVFQELPPGQYGCCETCRDGEAAYSWTKQGNQDARRDQIVCRVCAGMILLVGSAH